MREFITHDEAAILLPFQFRKNGFLNSITEVPFFLSFADAFRALMQGRKSATRTILAPDFYCPETLDLYAKYGDVVFYSIKDDLTVDEEAYVRAIRTHAPDIIVNYGFFGFPSRKQKIWSLLASLPETLVIEDCAHKILSREDIIFAHRNHVYIDSIRKQTSLLGSHLICQQVEIDIGSFQKINLYKFRCMFLRAVREKAIIAADFFRSRWFYETSEKYFNRLDDIIGTNRSATLGGKFTSALWNHINFKKVIEHKKDLIGVYVSGLADLNSEAFYIPPISNENIAYFPCIVSPAIQNQLIEHLERKNIWMGSLWELPYPSRFKLNEYLLGRVIVLPLTWRVSRDDAERICREIRNFFAKH